jgi:hypothetical protein
MSFRNFIDLIAAPLFILRVHQPIVEQPGRLVCPKSHQIVDRLDAIERLVDRVLPPRELSWRVNIMRLFIRGEVLLRLLIKLYHGQRELLSVLLQRGQLLEHGPVKRP